MFKLYSLGQLALRRDEQLLLRDRRKPLALLVYLARTDRANEREALADLLWTGRERELARKSLRQALSELRTAVGEALVTDGSTVRFALTEVAFDANMFESEIAAGHTESALSRWSGDFLAGLEDAGGEDWRSWIETQRARLGREYASASESAVNARIARGDWAGALELSERWLVHRPFDERACRYLLSSLDALGRRSEASARFAEFEQKLRAELDVVPSPELLQFTRSLRAPRLADARGASSTFSPDLIGRRDTMNALTAAYRESRKDGGVVVVVEGAAGSGKSRLVDEWLKTFDAGKLPPRRLQGRAFTAERGDEWSTLKPLVEQLADAPGLAAMPPERLAVLAALVPDLRFRFRALPQVGAEDVPRNVHRALTEVAADQPLIIAIDDVALSDPSSLDVIAGLVRRPPPNTLLVLSDRPERLAESLVHADLQQNASHVRHISLALLNAEQVGALIASMAPFDTHAVVSLSPRVQRESGGNPARIIDWVSKAVQDGALLRNSSGQWTLAARQAEPEHTTLPVVKSKRGVLQAMGAFVAVTLLALVGAYAFTSDPARVVVGSPILLADVETHGADKSVGSALHLAATVALQQSRQVTVFPRARVGQTLLLMGRRANDTISLTEPIALEIARRENIPQLLLLAVAQIDSAYVVTGRLLDVRTLRDVFAHEERARDASGLLAALDRLVDRVRSAVGESADTVTANRVPLPRVTTSSLDALMAYADGYRAWTERRYGDANRDWIRATALDSSFALAWLARAEMSYTQYNDRVAGDQFLDRALSRVADLSERERIRLQLTAAQRRGTAAEGIRLSRLLAERFPDRDTWYDHGTVQMRNRNCDDAVPALRKSLTFDSLFLNAWINIATCHQFAGRLEDAVEAYTRAGKIDSTALVSNNFNHEYGTALVGLRRFEDAEAIFQQMVARPDPSSHARGVRSLGYLQALRGQYSAAASGFESGAEAFRRIDAGLSEYRSIVLSAQAHITLGDTAKAARLLTRATQVALARKLNLEPYFLYASLQEHVRAGMLREAQVIRDSMARIANTGRTDDVILRQLADAQLLLTRGRAVTALQVLDSLQDTTRMNFVLPLRGQALAMTGDLPGAREAWRALARAAYFGSEWQDNGSRAQLHVALLSEQLGDTVAAIEGYRAYLAEFEAGDREFPELRVARRRLAALSR